MASAQELVKILQLSQCFDLSLQLGMKSLLFATCKAIIEIHRNIYWNIGLMLPIILRWTQRPGFWHLNAQLHMNIVAQVAKLRLKTRQPETNQKYSNIRVTRLQEGIICKAHFPRYCKHFFDQGFRERRSLMIVISRKNERNHISMSEISGRWEEHGPKIRNCPALLCDVTRLAGRNSRLTA